MQEQTQLQGDYLRYVQQIPTATVGDAQMLNAVSISHLMYCFDNTRGIRTAWDLLNRDHEPGTDDYQRFLAQLVGDSKQIIDLAFTTPTEVNAKRMQFRRMREQALQHFLNAAGRSTWDRDNGIPGFLQGFFGIDEGPERRPDDEQDPDQLH